MNKSGKKYYWCTRHNDDKGMWVLHTPQECRNCPRSDEGNHQNNEAEDRNDSNQEMPAIIKDDQDNDLDSDKSETP